MKKILVYDLPTRLFHWLFAIFFISAYAISNLTDPDIDTQKVIFSFHMLIGLTMVFIVALRFIWFFVGSRYAKISSFALKPDQLIEYFHEMKTASGKLFAGHNPASSWAAIAMIVLTLGIGLTGIMMATGTKGIKDVHEVMAHLFLAIVLAHIAGVVIHTIRRRDPIALSMIGGYKNLDEAEEIKSSHPIVALIFIALVGYFAVHIFTQFNPSTRTLNLMGQTLQLGDKDDEPAGSDSAPAGQDDD